LYNFKEFRVIETKMPGCCAVLGCRSRFIRGGKHFYRFPKNEIFKQLWVQFTRKGSEYEVKSCSAICEDHFEHNRVVTKKKGRLYLLKQTVPTIYYRESKEGTHKVTIEFDSANYAYVGEESVHLHRTYSMEHEERALMQERRQRVKELKSLCRFCFESQDERFVAINKLQAYSIDPDEMLLNIGIDPQYNEVFSEIVCEQCFQHIVSIDGYRKRCRKAQDEIIAEMQELDQKLTTIRNINIEDHPWYKFEEVSAEVSEDEQEEIEQQTQIDIIEEHLDDNISYVGDNDDEDYHNETFDEHQFETYKMEMDSKDFQHIIAKDDAMKEDEAMDIIEQTETDFDPDFDHTIEEDEENDDYNDTTDEFKDVYHIVDPDGVIKNPERNTFALRVYECFFCRLVSENILI
jgi:THAP domain